MYIFAGLQVTHNFFFFQSLSLIASTQLHIIMMLSWVVIFHFGGILFLFLSFLVNILLMNNVCVFFFA